MKKKLVDPMRRETLKTGDLKDSLKLYSKLKIPFMFGFDRCGVEALTKLVS